jgi:hypothetical protein
MHSIFTKRQAKTSRRNTMPRKTESTAVARLGQEMFLTETQLAARHQRSVKTLRNARVSGGYVPFVKIGRNVRYRLSDVLAFEQAALKRSTSDSQS